MAEPITTDDIADIRAAWKRMQAADAYLIARIGLYHKIRYNRNILTDRFRSKRAIDHTALYGNPRATHVTMKSEVDDGMSGSYLPDREEHSAPLSFVLDQTGEAEKRLRKFIELGDEFKE